MLGARRTQFETVPAKIVAFAALCVLAASWLMGVTRSFWAPPLADATHSYAIRFKGGTVLYFTPPIGWLLETSMWIVLVLLFLSVAIEFITRRRQHAADV